jgi:hypothetical protein
MILYITDNTKEWEYKNNIAFRNWMIKINNIYYCDIE